MSDTTNFTKLSQEDLARVTTRDGRKVEIITTKGREPCPVVGYIGEAPAAQSWSNDGRYLLNAKECVRDLILPPAPRVYYANVYPDGVLALGHDELEIARRSRSHFWLALYKITDDGVSDTLPCEVIERNKGA